MTKRIEQWRGRIVRQYNGLITQKEVPSSSTFIYIHVCIYIYTISIDSIHFVQSFKHSHMCTPSKNVGMHMCMSSGTYMFGHLYVDNHVWSHHVDLRSWEISWKHWKADASWTPIEWHKLLGLITKILHCQRCSAIAQDIINDQNLPELFW